MNFLLWKTQKRISLRLTYFCVKTPSLARKLCSSDGLNSVVRVVCTPSPEEKLSVANCHGRLPFEQLMSRSVFRFLFTRLNLSTFRTGLLTGKLVPKQTISLK